MKTLLHTAAYRASAFLIRRKHLWLAERLSPKVDESALNEICRGSTIAHCTDRLRAARIVLVGPSLHGSTEELIDDHDVVARIGFTGANSVPAKTGVRCDISVYARHHARKLAELVSKGEAPPIQEVLLRDNIDSGDIGVVKGMYRTRTLDREFLRAEMRCSPNILPQFAVWLLAQQPSVLHITNVDLFLTKNYPSEYAVNKPVIREANLYRHHNSSMWNSFAGHNPFTHLHFYKWLERRKNVSLSTDLQRIVGLSASEYGERLRAIY